MRILLAEDERPLARAVVKILEKNNYDACLIADFDDFEALDRYKKDPRHVAVSTLCKSIREARGAVDFEI